MLGRSTKGQPRVCSPRVGLLCFAAALVVLLGFALLRLLLFCWADPAVVVLCWVLLICRHGDGHRAATPRQGPDQHLQRALQHAPPVACSSFCLASNTAVAAEEASSLKSHITVRFWLSLQWHFQFCGARTWWEAGVVAPEHVPDTVGHYVRILVVGMFRSV
ncbi:hypothetical protein M758_UG151300 [Ceratodon purpureus]|nr:hypothetical protein M758_UG151300 [Ceratodon purpureus]